LGERDFDLLFERDLDLLFDRFLGDLDLLFDRFLGDLDLLFDRDFDRFLGEALFEDFALLADFFLALGDLGFAPPFSALRI
jgi:hypothetical protein